MHQLIYLSHASKDLNDQDIQDILEVSRRENEKVGTTGVLIHHKGIFIQVLEGEPKHILQLVENIRQDKRNSDLSVIYYEQIQERAFKGWYMGYHTDLPIHLVPANMQPISEIVKELSGDHRWISSFLKYCLEGLN
jgi:hypothetical protein